MATVLVVDDRVVNREFLSTLLAYANLEVLTAGDGAEALEVVRERRPDLVITDILMPTMDGFEFVNRLHDDPDPAISGVPIIFYTATYRLTEARDLACSCGVSKVLAKPAEPQEILDAVAELLEAPVRVAAWEEATAEVPGALGDALPHGGRGLVALERMLHRVTRADEATAAKTAIRPPAASSAVQALSLRMAATLELGLVLASERDPQRLLVLACRAARDILNARYAVIALGAGAGRPPRSAIHGMSDEQAARVAASLDPRAGVLGEMLGDRGPRRLEGADADPELLGLPAGHPPIDSLLAVPVATGSRSDGWLYAAGTLGADGFRESDEQFAVTIAAQLAPAYESLVLLGEVERHAERLEQEIAERERAAAELEESEHRFRELAENIREVFFLVDPANSRVLYVSPAYQEIWGLSPETLYVDGKSWADAIHPDDRSTAAQAFAILSSGGLVDTELRVVRPDGDQRWIRVRGFPIRDASGQVYRAAGLAEDVTERKEQQQRIDRLTRIYAVLSGINSAIVRIHDREELLGEACRIAVTEGVFEMAWIATIDPETRELEVIAQAGGGPDSLDTVRLTDRAGLPESDRPASRAYRAGRPVVCNDIEADPSLAGIRADLIARGFRSLAAFPLFVDGEAVGVLNLLGDETDLFDEEEVALLAELAGDISFGLQYIDKQERLDYLAYYDGLTGLANQTLFGDRLSQYLQGGKREGETVAVLQVDLDRFTLLNDTLGRHVGDRLLRAVAERLEQALDEPRLVARIGADSFGIVVPGLAQDTDAAAVVEERIFEGALAEPFAVEDREIRLTARAGIALYPEDGRDAETLIKNAEAALKRAQSSGERSLFYAPEITARAAERLTLEHRMREALDRRQFLLHYQPRLNCGSGRTVGLEALIRWNDPQAGLVGPAHFIPVLEESGMILEVGRWTLVEALSQRRRWQEAGLSPPPVSVNVSAVELSQPDFAGVVAAAIETAGAMPEDLELEITESLIMRDFEADGSTLRRIHEMGVMIAIDDFGTGYSSLRYLARLPADALKIDRSFIIGMVRDSDNMAIVSAVISLARSLRLEVVAEGVDSVEQAKMLRLMKCDEMQGFLFAKPRSPEEIETLLRAGGVFDLP